MSADVTTLPVVRVERSDGNGAREGLIAIAETLPTTLERPGDAERWADWVLIELWSRGFKVVPIE